VKFRIPTIGLFNLASLFSRRDFLRGKYRLGLLQEPAGAIFKGWTTRREVPREGGREGEASSRELSIDPRTSLCRRVDSFVGFDRCAHARGLKADARDSTLTLVPSGGSQMSFVSARSGHSLPPRRLIARRIILDIVTSASR